MRFSKEYSKLEKPIFTTIRKNTGFYEVGKIYKVSTPERSFQVEVIDVEPIKKEQITEEMAQKDADCSREELIKTLEKWYGKKFNDFVIIMLTKC